MMSSFYSFECCFMSITKPPHSQICMSNELVCLSARTRNRLQPRKWVKEIRAFDVWVLCRIIDHEMRIRNPLALVRFYCFYLLMFRWLPAARSTQTISQSVPCTKRKCSFVLLRLCSSSPVKLRLLVVAWFLCIFFREKINILICWWSNPRHLRVCWWFAWKIDI